MKRRREIRGKKECRWLKLAGFSLGLLIIPATIFVPGELLRIQGASLLEKVQGVSKDTYASERSAMAKRASAQLATDEKLQLIDGSWESELSGAEESEMELSETEVVRMAREQVAKLYENNRYPVSLASDYNGWYSFRTKAYKAVENTFETYGAYFWKLTFEKYDKSEVHVIWMLEDGTIFLAWAQKIDGTEWELQDEKEQKAKDTFHQWYPYGRICDEPEERVLTWVLLEQKKVGSDDEGQTAKIRQTRCAKNKGIYVYGVKYVIDV